MPSITASGPLVPLFRMLLPMGIFGLQAHICSSLQVPFCTQIAVGMGSQFRALRQGCRDGKRGPDRFRRAWSYLRAGVWRGRAWEICSQAHLAAVLGDSSPENRLWQALCRRVVKLLVLLCGDDLIILSYATWKLVQDFPNTVFHWTCFR